MSIKKEIINKIDSLFKEVDKRKSFVGAKPTFKDMKDLKEIKNLAFSIKTDDVENIKYVINVTKKLGEAFVQSIRYLHAVDCYNYIAKLYAKLLSLKELTSEELDSLGFDILDVFYIRNLYVYDDCEDIVALFVPYFDEEIVLNVRDEGKRKWLEGIKRDAIESTPKFQEVLDEVEANVLSKLEKDPNLNKWALYKKELKKKGIDWRSPADLNDGVLFD